MIFYTFLLSLFIILGILQEYFVGKKVNKYLLFLLRISPFILLFTVTILKNDRVGYDIASYHWWYDSLLAMDVPSGSYSSAEPGFRFVTEIFAALGLPFRVYVIAMYTLMYIPAFVAIYKLSKNSGFSIFIYCSLSIMVLNFSALRQGVALGFVFLAYYLLTKKKLIPIVISFCLIIIAGLFHKSAYVFLLAVPLMFIKVKPAALFYIAPIAIMFFFVSPSIFVKVYYSLGGNLYIPTFREDVGGYYFLYLAIFIFFSVFSSNNLLRSKIICEIELILKKIGKKRYGLVNTFEHKPDIDKEIRSDVLIFLLGVLFQSTSVVNYVAPRFATQFLMLSSIFIPSTMSSIEQKGARLSISSIIYICYYLFFLYDSIIPNYLGICPYDVFWH